MTFVEAMLNGFKEHITEYGVHWNFFITLALLPILQVLFHPVLARFSISGLGIALAIGTHGRLSPYRA